MSERAGTGKAGEAATLIAYGKTAPALERISACGSRRALIMAQALEESCQGRSAVLRGIAVRIEKLEYYRRGK